ncbi:MAG: DNA-3-methyladenine glycosylase [Verrucomicrobiia bacterium]
MDGYGLAPLPGAFFEPSARHVAPALLGHWLVRKTPQGLCGGPIVEAEAYLADDPACHAFGGRTPRNQVMWGRPGLAYVYFIYGNHYCVNAVCRPEGIAEAVLIRAIEPAIGVDLMLTNRPGRTLRELVNGPGKLCEALQITREFDGADLTDPESPLIIAENPELAAFLSARGPLLASRRIGISKAADLPLRFYLKGSSFPSKKREGTSGL